MSVFPRSVFRSLSVLCLLALAGCASLRPAAEPVAVTGVAYHSMVWQAKVARLPEGVTAQTLQQLLQRRLDEANAVLSTYQPDTELMRLNRAPVGEWVALSPLLADTLAQALEVSAATGGAYDVTVGPLVNLWGFGPQGRVTRAPAEEDIQRARALVGWHGLALDRDGRRARRLRPVLLDLSSAGEGAGSDVMAATLESLGVTDYLVGVAGSLRARGLKADGQPWRLAIEQPDGSGLPSRSLDLRDAAISTSGSYRNYFEQDGVRYSHTIDPASGRPISHRGVSVTVVLPGGSDTLADAWATGLNVLGPDRGLALAERLGLAVCYIERTDGGFRARESSAFTRLSRP